MTIRLMFFCLLLANTGVSLAQQLTGRTFLGIAPVSSAENANVEISQVILNSTASALGVKTGDVVISVNGRQISNFQSLLDELAKLSVGRDINVGIIRDEQRITLKGQMQSRPREQSQFAKVHYQQVKLGNDYLRTIVHQPLELKSGNKAPAIFFLQGYTCSSIDYGMFPHSSGKQLVDQFTQAGFVVYRIEKFGVGDSLGERQCSQVDFTTEVSGFVAGLKALKQLDYVDSNNIVLWGHSLGVLYAPVIASQEKVAGIAGYGGVAKPWDEYLLDIFRWQSVKHFNVSEQRAIKNTNTIKPLIDAWLNTDSSWQQIIKQPAIKKALALNLVPVQGEQVFHRHYHFFRDLNQYDFSRLWKNSDIPVLMMHGSLDIQAIDGAWTKEIAQLVNANHQGLGTAKIIDGAEHAFMRYQNQQAYQQAQRSSQYNPTNAGELYDTRIAQATIEWIASEIIDHPKREI